MTTPTDIPPDGETKPPAPDNTAVEAAYISTKPTADKDSDERIPSDAILAHPEWGSVNMLAMAASFGSVVPGAVSAAYDNLFWTIERNGEGSLANGGGPLTKINGIEYDPTLKVKEGGDDNEDDDGWDQYIEIAEHRREERERAEWARTEHSYAGVTKTGAEWLELSEKLRKGGILHDWLVEQMRKDGEEDPESLADLVRIKMEMQGTPEHLWTEEQKQADAYLKAHPEIEDKVAKYTALVDGHDLEMKAASSADLGGINPDEKLSNNASTTASVDAGADLFSTAPNLKEHHEAALAATEPLDAKPLPKPEPPLPPRTPQVAVAAAPGGGFDV
jgi:hypothetical protein